MIRIALEILATAVLANYWSDITPGVVITVISLMLILGIDLVLGNDKNPAIEMANLSIPNLQDQHRQIFQRAVVNVVTAPTAEVTYGQIIDGILLSSAAMDTYLRNVCPGHPLSDEHLQLSVEVLERARQLRDSFDLNILQFDAEL